ncbi:hypothetical protein FISHEDRAFT_62496 [Fistulina hepatica ATCC 64428]|nr:hypothetical protein FISHEDRAFT_62496 [Fistulina hepatica ATCC 64428]
MQPTSNEIEMDDLRKKPESTTAAPKETDDELDTSVASAWSWAAATLLASIGAVFSLFPRFLLFLSEAGSLDSRSSLTPLETFLAVHFGIWLCALAIMLVLQIPSSVPVPPARSRAPPTHPLMGVSSTAACLSSLVAYNSVRVGALGVIVCIAEAVIGLWGMWGLAFSGSGEVSSTTGADKHTSAFIFGNKNAASSIKKRWRKEQGH